MGGEDYSRLIYLVLLLMAVGGWVIVEFRHRMGQTLRIAMAWGLIFIGFMAGYGLWQDITGKPGPRQMVSGESEITLPRAADGHFYAAVQINGTEVFFLADTGATNMVLSRRDAERIGLDPNALYYLGEASTANGTVRTARITLDSVAFGPFQDTNFPAYVNDGEMDGSLLGMEYLRRFNIRMEADRMVLTR